MYAFHAVIVSALIWAAMPGYVIWGDIPDIEAITEALLIVASALYVIHREAKLVRQ